MRDDLDPSLMGGSREDEDHPSRFPSLRCLGIGPLVETFLCKDTGREGREVVRKFLNEDFSAENPDLIDLYLPRLAALSHPALVPILEYGWEEGRIYINYEYIEGKNFEEVLKTLSPDQAFELIGQLLVVLDYLFAHNVLHLDLKPKNILIVSHENKLQLKLIDYGLAALFFKPTRQESESVGTPPYASPEFAIRHYLDVRSDLYSVGVLLYLALCKRLPFEGKDAVEVLQAQLKQDPSPLKPLPSGVPPKISELISKLLTRDPQSRWESPRAVLRALTEILGKSPVPWPPLFSDPDEVFFYEEQLRLFRKIILQGGRWAIQGPKGSGKSFLARWFERLFWLNQRSVFRLNGKDIALLEGEHSLNPGEATYLIIDDADRGPTEAWLNARPYTHVVTFGEATPWAKDPKRWQTIKLTPLAEKQLKQIFEKDFAQTNKGVIQDDDTQRISFLLALSQVPVSFDKISSGIKLSDEKVRAGLATLLHEAQIERSVRFGIEYFQTQLSLPLKADPVIQPTQVKEWLEGLYEEQWFDAGLVAMEHYYSPTKLKEPELSLLHAKFLEATAEHHKVFSLVTSAFVGQLGDHQKSVAYETLGKSLLQSGRAKQAETAFQRALEQDKTNQDFDGQARAFMYLGECFQMNQDQQKAVEYFKHALTAAEKTEHPQKLRGLIEFKIGQFYAAANDFENAAERYESSLQHLYPLGPTLTLAQVCFHYAALAYQMRNILRAEGLLHEGLRISVFKLAWGLQGKILLLAFKILESNTLVSFERLCSAIFALEKTSSNPAYVEALVERATIWDNNRQQKLAQQDAEQALQEARRLKDSDLEGIALLALGKIYSRDVAQIQKALEQLTLAKKTFEASHDEAKLGDCELAFAEIESQRGNHKESKAHYTKAIKLIEGALKHIAAGTQESHALEMKRMHAEMKLQSLS